MYYIVYVFDDGSTEVVETKEQPGSPRDYLARDDLWGTVSETFLFEGKRIM
jgi:hypothetical protein